MNTQLDPHVKAVFENIVAHTPDIGPTPSGHVMNLGPGRSPQGRRWLAVAAAAVVVVGVGALAAVQRQGSDTPDMAPAAQPLDPTLATDSTVVSEVPVTGSDAETVSTPVGDDPATPATTAETPELAGSITSFERLGTGESVTLIDTDRVTIVARYESTTTAPYCVDLSLDGFNGPACGDREAWSDGQLTFGIRSIDRTRKLVGQIVPDSVTAVTTSDGRTITPVSNVWWDATSIDSATTYTLNTDDGASIEVPSPINVEE